VHSVSFKHNFVDVAPKPIFAWFDGLYDGVLSRAEMLAGVFVLRGIAATYMAAALTEAQVDPRVTHLKALLAAVGFWLWIPNLIGVRASLGHNFSSIFYWGT